MRDFNACVEHDQIKLLFEKRQPGGYYTGCPRRNVLDFGRAFRMLKYSDITQNMCPKLNGYGDNGQRSLKL